MRGAAASSSSALRSAMATVAGPTATTYNPQGSTRYFGPLQPNHKSQSGRLHDRWTEGTGEDDAGLQTEYGERSRNARAGGQRREAATVPAPRALPA